MPYNGREALETGRALRNQNLDLLCELLIKHGERIDELSGNSPLYIACAEGDLRVAKFLVEKGKMNFNEKSKTGMTPLEIATINGHTDVVDYLQQALQKEKEEQIKKTRLQEIQSIDALIATKRREISSLKMERDQNAIDLMDKISQERFRKIEDSISNQA